MSPKTAAQIQEVDGTKYWYSAQKQKACLRFQLQQFALHSWKYCVLPYRAYCGYMRVENVQLGRVKMKSKIF